MLLRLSLPGIVSMVTIALYNIIDTFWVAKLGHEAIGALTITLPYHILIIAFGVGTGIGVNSLVSRRFGENNPEETNHAAGQIFPVTAFFGSIFLVAGVSFPQPILNVLGATPDIMDYATQYLTIISLGAPFLFFSLAASDLLRGSGDAVRPMIFMLTASITNIILDPFLIFGIGPFPEMGVRGAATATALSQFLNAGLNFYYLTQRRSAYHIKIWHLQPNLRILRDIYRVGFPAMLTEITESVVFALFNNVVSTFSSLALAAVGIGVRIIDLAYMPVIGISTGLLPIIGFNFGARIWKRLWGSVRLASISVVLLIGTATILLEVLTPSVVRIFSDDPELIAMAVPAIRVIIAPTTLFGMAIIFITTFEGLNKGRAVLILSLARQFIFFVPMLFLLPRVMGITGAWLSIPISDVLGFLITAGWLWREYRLQRHTGTWVDLPDTNG